MPPKRLKRKVGTWSSRTTEYKYRFIGLQAGKERGAESKESSGPQVEQQSSNKPEQTPEEVS